MASTEDGTKAAADGEVKKTELLFSKPAEDEEDKPVEEEECQADFEPVVKLSEVDTKTGEEEEEVLYKQRAKLFRHAGEGGWKERGLGDVKLLKHKENKRIRLLMRREKTLKICLNHYVNTDIELQENIGSERSWVWSAVDYADGDRDECVLAIRFPNVEIAQEFRKEYDKARDYMKTLLEEEDEKDDSKEEQKEKSEETKEAAEEKKDA
ncbi:hypothetical protein NDN08_002628 [Rhodosorus marinus]|uniref:RanBD1 domain-containing protein n=1 Tax=Rhodosorus marinus TaxID=101924 RepID=A0AAV8UUA5_9RHOD|nr:hypothetical protein NDN08_002628 [Rhodosorus marinus]